MIAEAGGLGGAEVLANGLHLLADKAFIAMSDWTESSCWVDRPCSGRSTSLLADPGVGSTCVAPIPDYPDPAGNSRVVAPSLGPLTGPARGLARPWSGADAATGSAVDAVLDGRDVATSPVLARTVAAALPGVATLVVASSQPPRDLGMFAAARDGVHLVANRGVAGIDGLVSTSCRRRAGRCRRGPDYALLGDLALLHDITGLAIGPHEPRPDLTIVVANNDGGGIFATLEPGEPLHDAAFERVFGTPTGATLGSIVEGFGAEHLLAVTADDLIEAVGEPPSGTRSSRSRSPEPTSGPTWPRFAGRWTALAEPYQAHRPRSRRRRNSRTLASVATPPAEGVADRHHLDLRLAGLGLRIRDGDDPASGDHANQPARHLGAAQRDGELAVAVRVHPADRCGVSAARHRLQIGDHRQRDLRRSAAYGRCRVQPRGEIERGRGCPAPPQPAADVGGEVGQVGQGERARCSRDHQFRGHRREARTRRTGPRIRAPRRSLALANRSCSTWSPECSGHAVPASTRDCDLDPGALQQHLRGGAHQSVDRERRAGRVIGGESEQEVALIDRCRRDHLHVVGQHHLGRLAGPDALHGRAHCGDESGGGQSRSA